MAASALATLLAEPAITDPPRRVWRDWLIVGIFVPAALLEGVLRSDVTWRPLGIALVIAMAVSTLWRRTAPLAVTVFSFGSIIVFDQVARLFDRAPIEFYSSAFVLVLPYALFRWGSGRHGAIGIGVLVAVTTSSAIVGSTAPEDLIGGVIVMLLPVVFGIEVRHLTASRERKLTDVKALEREMLARDLHDTVAHHVSAIAIRAQAGRVVGANDPTAALDALAVIEHEASRTLTEMRNIVGSLRGTDAAELAPQPGVAQIIDLAVSPGRPTVEVEIADDLANELSEVSSTIGAALYRVAQEAITNARRHAVGASTVTVTLTTQKDNVRLVVADDGRSVDSRETAGFGIVGMTERAELLGGSLHAGPHPGGGWRVDAMIPLHSVTV